MKREPPRIAVWLLTRVAYGNRGSVILGDLLERFEEGESRAWFWRQTLAALAHGFVQAGRDHGRSFASALAAAIAVYVVMDFANGWLAQHVIHFQTHGLLEIDPHWNRHWGWKIAFAVLGISQSTLWYVFIGWLVARMHRAQPRLIVFACVVALLAARLHGTIGLAQDVLTHRRFLPYFISGVTHLLLTIALLVVGGIWGKRRNTRRAESRQA